MLEKSREAAAELPLIDAARGGDLAAFSVLYERHKDVVFQFVLRSIGRREDAEDLVQETFCRAWTAIGRFRGEARFRTWVTKIAASACADHLRTAAQRSRLAREVPLEDEVMASDLAVPDAQQANATRQAIIRALHALPLQHRQLVILCDVQGFTSREAATILGCSAVSVRVRLCRAHEQLRQLLSTDDEVQ